MPLTFAKMSAYTNFFVKCPLSVLRLSLPCTPNLPPKPNPKYECWGRYLLLSALPCVHPAQALRYLSHSRKYATAKTKVVAEVTIRSGCGERWASDAILRLFNWMDIMHDIIIIMKISHWKSVLLDAWRRLWKRWKPHHDRFCVYNH